MMSRAEIVEAKRRITIPIVWLMLGLPGKPKPGKLCRAPYRRDSSPSLLISRDGTRFIDFGTGNRGDVIDFLALARGLSASEAFIELLKFSGASSAPNTVAAASWRQPSREPLKINGLETCTHKDLETISSLRSIPIDGLRLASDRRLLFICDYPQQGHCWVITDDARRNAIARRIDGKRFQSATGKEEGSKSRNLKGSEANWPIGAAQASGFPAIALCEGGPDFLSAFYWAFAGAVEQLVAPICMTGAACSIHKEALPMLHGKRVRIFGHADNAGQAAMQRWAEQLRGVQAEVDGFDFSGLLKLDGSPVMDLNDMLHADKASSDCAIEVLTGAMDFALERRV
jgi:hypothetical protein